MRSYALGMLLLFTGGCLPSRTGRVEERRSAEVTRISHLAMAKLVMPSCNHPKGTEPPPGGYPPRHHYAVDHGTRIRQACGWIVAEILADAYIKNFLAEACGGNDDAACMKRFS